MRTSLKVLLPLLLLLALPAVVQAQFTFTTNNGAITITGYTGPGGVVTIPSTINFLPVTSIGDWAFYSTSVTNILIPDNVTNIGDGAFFDCESLTRVTIGDSVTNIGDWTFAFCSSLTSVCFRGNAPNLGGVNVFYGNLATVYYLPETTGWEPMFAGHPAILWNPPVPFTYTINNDAVTITGYTGSDVAVTILSMINFLPVTGIGNSAFIFNSDLTNVIIPDGVTSIGSNAFLYCDNLITVTIPNSVTNIGAGAFQWCKSLTSAIIPDGVKSLQGGVFYDCVSLATISFPTNITSIGWGAFWGCSSMTDFVIPNSVTDIGDAAFEGTGLSSVTIPNSITSIGYMTFSGCGSLTNVTMPESVTNITSWAFSYCGSLTSIKIPNGVTTVEHGVFYDCPNLTSVTIGTSVTSILQDAFGNTGLTSINIPNNVTSIDADAFASTGLTNITLGNGVTSMGDSFYTCPFYGCPNLMAITVDTSNPAYCSVNGVLFDKNRDTLIECPRGLAGSYTVPGSVTNIGNYAFYYCTSLNAVYFQGNAPSLGAFVFTGDNNATIYYLPGMTGWPTPSWGVPEVLWNPQVQSSGATFGIRTNQFGFTVTGTSNLVIVVEACTDPGNPVWLPVSTNTLTGGSAYFRDSEWTNYPARFYRLRSP